MIIACILATTIGLVLLLGDPGNRSTRWASYMLFAAGAGFLGFAAADWARDFTGREVLGVPLERVLSEIQFVGQIIGTHVFPCFFAGYAILSSERFQPALERILLALLWIPPSAVLSYTWLFRPEPSMELLYLFTLIWVAVYLIGGCVLLIAAYIHERNPLKKRNRGAAVLFFVPAMLVDLVTGYAGEVIGIYQLRYFNTVLVTGVFVLFALLLVRSGVLGLRLRMEKLRFESSIEGFNSGTEQLNHAIKNQAGKMLMFEARLKQLAARPSEEDALRLAQRIGETGGHLLHMVDRIHSHTQELLLRESDIPLIPLVEAALEHPGIRKKNIAVRREYVSEIVLRCDPVHLTEAITNVISNACDAMEEGGMLVVSLSERGKRLHLSVQDNGHGMDRATLAKAAQPFFTTKTYSPEHFGVGLLYCQRVMEHHQGELSLSSESGQGTTVTLSFPLNRVEKHLYSIGKETRHEPNSSLHRGG